MITLRRIKNLLSKRVVDEPLQLDWRGLTVGDLAQTGDSRVILNDKAYFIDEVESEVIPDDSTLCFIETPTDIGQLVLEAVISTVVAFYVGQLLAPSADDGGGKDISPTYGFEAITNGVANGSVVPVVYGEHLMGGIRAMGWRTASFGQEGTDNQVFTGAYILSEGPVEEIGGHTTDQDELDGTVGKEFPTGMLINGQPLENYTGVKVWTRLGGTTSALIPPLNRAFIEYPISFPLDHEDEPFEWLTKDKVKIVRVNLCSPKGMFRARSSGDIQKIGVDFKIQLYDDTGISLLRTSTFHVESRSTNPVFFTRSISEQDDLDFDPRRYVVRVTRTVPADALYLTAPKHNDQLLVCGILESAGPGNVPQWHGMAMIGVTIEASENLQGSEPTVLTQMKGRKIKTPGGDEVYTDSPADICRDILINKKYGLGNRLSDSNVNTASLNAYRAECVASIPTYTGSGSNESRYVFDGVFDVRRQPWETVKAVCRTCRTVPLMTGNDVTFKLEKQQNRTQVLSEANCERITISYLSRKLRADSVELAFRNELQNYELDYGESETLGLDETTGYVRKTTDMFGATRDTQINRLAAYFLRVERKTGKACSIEAMAESIHLEVGDRADVVHSAPDWGWSGRLQGSTDSNATLDKTITFDPLVTYTMLEHDPLSDATKEKDFVHTGTTAVLPFEPQFGLEGAEGRMWAIGPKEKLSTPFLITGIETQGDDLTRVKITGLEYNETVYTDEAEQKDDGVIVGTPLAAPDDVTSLTAVETSTINGVSTITLNWVAGANAEQYHIYVREEVTDNEFEFVGTTDGISFAHNTRGGAGLGTPLEYAVLTETTDGRLDDGDVSTGGTNVSITLTREGRTKVLAVFPDQVTNLAFALDSGALYTLSWDAVAGADSYSVRINNWNAGKQVFNGTGTSVQVRVHAYPITFHVRAKEGNQWSEKSGVIASPVVVPPGFTTESLDKVYHYDDDETLRQQAENKAWTPSSNGLALLHIQGGSQTIWTSDTTDLGSIALTDLSLFSPVVPYIKITPEQFPFFTTMQNWNSHGKISSPTYIDYTWEIWWSEDGTNFQSVDWDLHETKVATTLVRSGRYFFIKLKMRSLERNEDDIIEDFWARPLALAPRFMLHRV